MENLLRTCTCTFILVLVTGVCCTGEDKGNVKLPVIINTWPFVDANKQAVKTLLNGGTVLDAIEQGCTVCEVEQCDGSVGYGGSPDENGETTLDAMIMDGDTHDVGSVGCLRNVKSAISVARSIMEHTSQTLLVGSLATDFAKEMGFTIEDLSTNKSKSMWNDWRDKNCQPNFWNPDTVSPDPKESCGPYQNKSSSLDNHTERRVTLEEHSHDTIGMIIVDANGRIACGTTTNGLNHKIPGRVGDSPIVGAGCYVEKGVGGAAATGDGDIMMRFLPSYRVVQSMKSGMSPTDAVKEALAHIASYYPSFNGALIGVNVNGDYGGAGHGFSPFPATVYNPTLDKSTVIDY